VLALAGFLLTIAAFHPGIVTNDSLIQYRQALSGDYVDHHPTVMAWLWSFVDRAIPGPAGMLLLHAALMWTALWLFADGAVRRGLRRAWLPIAAGFLPMVIGIEGAIWKDVGMAATLLFATSIVYRQSAAGARPGVLASALVLVSLYYATVVRSNAPAATLPILVYWAIVTWRGKSRARCAGIGIGVLVLMLVVQWGIDARVLHAKRAHMSQILEVFDLAAIRCGGGTATIPPQFLRSDAGAKPLCEAFDPVLVDYLYVMAGNPAILTTDRSALRALGRAWRAAIVANPLVYLEHRAQAFAGAMGAGVDDAARAVFVDRSTPSELGFAFAPNTATRVIGAASGVASALDLYNGFVWLALAVALLAAAMRREPGTSGAATIALGTSALLYLLPYFFVALAPDYRYIYWAVVATTIAAVLTLLDSPRAIMRIDDAIASCIRRARAFRDAWPRRSLVALAGVGTGLTLIAYYPGEVTFDSIWQFNQVVSGVYMDHHPPIMAWVWSGLNRVVPGPFGLLLLHAALIWSGLLLLADGAARRGIRHAWLVLAVGFLPPVLGIEGEIWKDIGMTGALLLATGLVYRASARARGIDVVVAGLALLPLFYATAVRANAPAASAPILVYWAYNAFRRASLRTSIAIGVAALAALLGAQWAFDNKFLDVRHAHLSQFVEVYDLAAMRCAGGDATVPQAFMRDDTSASRLCDAFDPLKVDYLFAPEGAPLAASTDPDAIRELGQAWRQAIVSQPLLYLGHRLRAFGAVLGFDADERLRPVWIPYSIANAFGFTFVPNLLTDAIGATVPIARSLGLYNGLLWLIVACAVLGTAATRIRRGLDGNAGPIALASSAIAYTLPYFFISIAPDYRYIHWTVTAAAVAAVLTMLRSSRVTTGLDRTCAWARRLGARAGPSSSWRLAAIAAAGAVLTLVAFWPGVVSVDSIWQYEQAYSGIYWDHHPPLMAWLWAQIMYVVPGTAGMLLLHVTLMWGGLLFFADGASRRGFRHAWAIVAIGFLPPIVGIEGAIWKDVGMVASLLFGTAVVYRASAAVRGIGRIAAAIAFVPLAYGTIVRANAPAASLPLLVYWAWQANRRLKLAPAIATAVVALSMIYVAQWVFDTQYLHARRSHYTQYLQAFDLAAIACAGGDATIPPSFFRHATAARPLCDMFDPIQLDSLFVPWGAPLEATTDGRQLDELAREWRRAIFANPRLYLAHRLDVFETTMGIGLPAARRLLWFPHSVPNRYGLSFTPNAATHAVGAGVALASTLHLYDGLPWLALAAVLGCLSGWRCRRGEDATAELALSISALAYTLPYFIVGVAPDFRYLYWTVAATSVATMLALVRLRQSASSAITGA
jgi:hypothetical protein